MPVNGGTLESRRRVLTEQPKTKWINVTDVHHGHPRTKRMLVNQNIRDVEHLKQEITNSIKPLGGAVRNIYTPAGGTEVVSLDQIENDKAYVAGAGKFRRISQGLNQGSKSVSDVGAAPKGKAQKPTNRISLIERQILAAEKAKSSLNSSLTASEEPSPNISKRSTPRYNDLPKISKNKYKNIKRKPLYPGRKRALSETKDVEAPAETFKDVSDKFRRASTKSQRSPSPPRRSPTPVRSPSPRSPSPQSRKSTAKSRNSAKSRDSARSNKSYRSRGSAKSNKSRSRSPSVVSRRSADSRRSRSHSPSVRSRTPSPDQSRRGTGKNARSLAPRTSDRRVSLSPSDAILQSRRSSKASSRGSSRASSRAASRASSRAASRASSRAASRASSRAASRASSRAGSRSSSRAASRAASRRSSRASRRESGRALNRRDSRTSSRGASRASSRSRSRDSRASSRGSSRASSRRSSRASSRRSSRASSRRSSRRSSRASSVGSSSSYPVDRDGVASGRRNSLLTIRTKRSAGGEDEYARSHKSVRYGSTFSSRSHKMNITATGEGALNNDGYHSSLLSREGSGKSIFKASSSEVSRETTPRTKVEVDYDRDESGLFRAKSGSSLTEDAKTVMENSSTKINTPFELIPADEVEEDGFFDSTVTQKLQKLKLK